MKRRYWIVGLSVIAVALLIGLGVWGYQEHQMKKTVMINAENHYQQAFHELTYYVDSLEESLGTALAMQSRESMRPQLVETWRLSALAHAAANELPLTFLPFNRTNEFLAHVGEFTYNTGVKTINDRPLSSKEFKNLTKLYSESMTIRDELRDVQAKVMAQHLRWMDVEQALKSKKQNQDNQVIDGMKRVDGQATEYTQSFSPENPHNVVLEKKKINPMKGAQVKSSQAIENLKKWVNKPHAQTRKVTQTGKGSNVPAYEILMNDKGRSLNASVTKKGGHITWFLFERPVKKETINLYDASKRSENFLKQRQVKDMILTKRNKYNHVAVLTYVLQKKGVRIYPASMRIKVALDNGEILAFDQTDYLFNKYDHVPLQPKLSEKEARKQLNSNLNVQESELAVFQNPMLKNVLCYEFFATRNNDTYRVMLNADNGDQEKIELLKE
ncbi:germination protein YpeB [Sporolactobacillus shoreicorticis]|uniref:Germination protein YpeB n=1 Tax=Sporolactobacillus shoreicorticis TaxID=1923877 RepID=A0ABW5RZW8_9BACL|nr:germination protein YpeB [Sporolactobacillus shoreicorticis]MCO7127049.1 germination protein YpeB [Sporolactobacillus shoreicorticis]